jgi:hypothetical protein
MSSSWSLRRLWLVLYPFVALAKTINLYMLALIWVWVGLPVLSPYQALIGGALIGVPVSYACARTTRQLIAQADHPL